MGGHMKEYHGISRPVAAPRASRIVCALIACSALTLPVHAQGTRAEAVSRGALVVDRGCWVTPPAVKQPVASAGVGVILGTMLAGVAGDLVGSGLNALGSAIESASQEKGFVAEGLSSFAFYSVASTDVGGAVTWGITPDLAEPESTEARCIILARDGGAKSPGLSDAALRAAFPALDPARATEAVARLAAAGITRVPGIYLEAELHRELDGMTVRPVLLRYGEALPGAPAKETQAELVVTFATPGGADSSDLGELFALSRIPLPKVTPGNAKSTPRVWSRKDLSTYRGIVVPFRPTTGSPDDILKARNGLETALDAKRKEAAQLVELQKLAKRNLDQNADPAERQALLNAYDDATAAVSQAEKLVAALAVSKKDWATTAAGSTNIKARFIVIRDANGFGMAIAKALKGQSEALGKAVTAELTPEEKKPAWTGDDTAYVEAQADVRAAQRALDEAIGKGETSLIPGLQDAVLKAQAHANQAAVAAGRPLPYTITP